jgi:hypothetical protein
MEEDVENLIDLLQVIEPDILFSLALSRLWWSQQGRC